MSEEMEMIFEAAIREPNGQTWQIGRPGRRDHLIRLIDEKISGEKGFITSTARFVDRFEACKIARAAGQIIEKTGPDDELFPEDMW